MLFHWLSISDFTVNFLQDFAADVKMRAMQQRIKSVDVKIQFYFTKREQSKAKCNRHKQEILFSLTSESLSV